MPINTFVQVSNKYSIIFTVKNFFRKDFQKLRDGTLACTIEFFQSLLQVIEDHHRQIKEEKEYRDFVCEDSINTPED